MKRTLKQPTKKGKIGVQWIIWAIVMALLVWFFWDMTKDPVTGSMTSVFLVLIVVISGCLCAIPASNRKKKAQKEETSRLVAEGLIPVGQGQARHVAGLPITTGVPCAMKIYSNRVSVEGAGQLFEVPMGRVTGSQLYEDTEMRQHISRSLGGTILGGIAFGEVGAIIGAMPESKYRKEVSKYNLLVSYTTEENEPKALLFTSDSPLKSLGKVIQQYRRGIAGTSTTVL